MPEDCTAFRENFPKKVSFRNHLRFNLRCLHEDLTPRSLKLKSCVKGHRANVIIDAAQRKLLNERIRQTNFKIELLSNEQQLLLSQLSSDLPAETIDRVKEFTVNAQLSQHTKTKKRQIKKFTALKEKSVSRADLDTNWRSTNATEERWVQNLSTTPLTDTEISVLSKGLNYAVTPKSIQPAEFITTTETVIKRAGLTQSDAEELRAKVSACIIHSKPPKSNLSQEEHRALHILKKDKTRLILPADKGGCTVVLERIDYDNKIQELVADTKTYERLKKDPTATFKRKITEKLLQLLKSGIIDTNLKHRLYPSAEYIPALYGLPKIHKPGVPLRPIVSSIGSVTYNIAKHLAGIIGPLVGTTKHYVKSSQDFVNKISHLALETDETIVSFDVTNLFTCIPSDVATRAVKTALLADRTLPTRTKLSPSQICDLLRLCLDMTYFIVNGPLYRQKHGCAMGSPISPIVVNIYMEQFEKQVLETFVTYYDYAWT